jgi:Flp pilus assembly protein TadD
MPQPSPSPVPRLLAAATAALKAGRPAEAIAPLHQAAAYQPTSATILHDLGVAYLGCGRLQEAATTLQHATLANPRDTDAHFRLGIALERLGDAPAAIAAYDRATTLLPGHTEAWFRAGALVFTLGHREEAIGCFRRAAAAGPKTRFGRLAAARILLAEHRDQDAERALRRLLALDPGNAMAQDLLGNVLADAGRFDEARTCFARAIAAAPLMAGSYYDLVRCRRMTPEDAGLIGAMQQALTTPELDPAQALRVHLAIGKAADDLGEYELAMRHCDAADRLRRTLLTFNAAAFDAQIDAMIARFTPVFFGQAAGMGSDDPTPLLITGMPRSGTTLTEQILSSHPDVTAGGELNFWNERGLAWLAAGAGLDPSFLQTAAADYRALLRGIGGTPRVTDKMPFNFLWIGLIAVAFPRATIIQCRRDPIDTALSIHQTHFNPRVAFPTGGTDLVTYFRAYDRLTRHWRTILPADRLIDVDYEKLTSTPEPVIRHLVPAAELPWHDACLAPERNARIVRTPSKWQARQKITSNAVQRWRRYEPWLGALNALSDINLTRGAPNFTGLSPDRACGGDRKDVPY